MSYGEHLTELGRGLAVLASHGSEALTGRELDVALNARDAVIELLAVVHRDLTGIHPRAVTTSAADIQAHPVAAFARALADHPRIAGPLAPSEALTAEMSGPAGQTWQRVARHAVLAGHEWGTGVRQRIGDAEAWTGVRDVATVGALLAVLDRDLATAAGALPDRSEHARTLGSAADSGLEVIAREVVRVATAGPLGEGPDRVANPPRAVLPVRSVADLVPAEQRLAALLRTTPHLRPERHHVITIGHVRVCEAVANALRAGSDPGLRAAAADLTEHTRLLAHAVRRPARVASIQAGSPLPMRQAAEIHQNLEAALTGASPEQLRRLLPVLGDTTKALSEVAERHLRNGAWLVPAPLATAAEPGWVPVESRKETPPPLQALERAGAHAGTLTARAAGTAPSPSGPGWRPALPTRPVQRPLTPARPVSGPPEARRRRR